MKKTKSETDWDRVLAFKEGDRIPFEPGDGPYDPNDAEAARAWFAQADLIRKGKIVRRGKRGPQKAPTKKLVSLRLSPEVVEHFKSTGPGWQTRIDRTLAEAIKRRASVATKSMKASRRRLSHPKAFMRKATKLANEGMKFVPHLNLLFCTQLSPPYPVAWKYRTHESARLSGPICLGVQHEVAR